MWPSEGGRANHINSICADCGNHQSHALHGPLPWVLHTIDKMRRSFLRKPWKPAVVIAKLLGKLSVGRQNLEVWVSTICACLMLLSGFTGVGSLEWILSAHGMVYTLISLRRLRPCSRPHLFARLGMIARLFFEATDGLPEARWRRLR